MLEKFAQKDPSCVSYDEKLQFYDALSDEVRYVNTRVMYVHTYILMYINMCICLYVCMHISAYYIHISQISLHTDGW